MELNDMNFHCVYPMHIPEPPGPVWGDDEEKGGLLTRISRVGR